MAFQVNIRTKDMSVIISFTKSSSGVLTNTSRNGPLRLIFVRWRKPRWIPKAPSKIYRVRTPTETDPEEQAFLLKQQHIYSTEMKTIKYVNLFVIKEIINWHNVECHSL